MVSVLDYEACDLGSIPSSGGIIDLLFSVNAGQISLGSSRPESSRPGSTRTSHLPLVLYSLLFSIIRMPVPFFLCVLLKCSTKV